MGLFAEIQEKARQAKLAQKLIKPVVYPTYFEIDDSFYKNYDDKYYCTKHPIFYDRPPYLIKNRYDRIFSESKNVWKTLTDGKIIYYKKDGKLVGLGSYEIINDELKTILKTNSIEYNQRTYKTGKRRKT